MAKKYENAENSNNMMPNLELPVPAVEEKEEKVEFEQKQVFKEKQVALEVKDKDQEVVKRYIGQRGKDKKKRTRKPPSIAQLEHLKRARKAAVEKRRLIREEKQLASQKSDNIEDLKKQWEKEYEEKRSSERMTASKEQAPLESKNEILTRETVPKKKPKEVPEETEDYNMESFFCLMDQWEQRKKDREPPPPPKAPHQAVPKIQKKKSVKPLPQRHPNRNIPQALRPRPPVVRNIFADCF